MSGLFDSHCHLDFPDYDADRAEVVARAKDAGVDTVLIPGVSPRTWDRALVCRDRWPDTVRIALGVQPWYLAELSEAEVDEALRDLPGRLRETEATAVGECGLDGAVARGGASLGLQTRVLRAHLEIAAELDLPVILHCYRAHGLMIQLLQLHQPVRGVLHGYSGSAELIERYAKLGLAFSFGGPITWDKARRPVEACQAVPDHLLLLETDGPNQPPEGHRPGRSEPAHLAEIAAKAEALRGKPLRDNRALLLG